MNPDDILNFRLRHPPPTAEEWAAFVASIDLPQLAATNQQAIAMLVQNQTRLPEQFRTRLAQTVQSIDQFDMSAPPLRRIPTAILFNLGLFNNDPAYVRQIIRYMAERDPDPDIFHEFAESIPSNIASLSPETANAALEESLRIVRARPTDDRSMRHIMESALRILEKRQMPESYTDDQQDQLAHTVLSNVDFRRLDRYGIQKTLELLDRHSISPSALQTAIGEWRTREPALLMRHITIIALRMGDEPAAALARELLQRPNNPADAEQRRMFSNIHQNAFFESWRLSSDRSPLTVEALRQGIQFSAFRYQELEKIGHSYASNYPQLREEVLSYIIEHHPRMLLRNANYGQGDGNEVYIRRTLERLGYDVDALEWATGLPMRTMPIRFFTEAASARTLAPEVLDDPARVFADNIPGFAARPANPLPSRNSGYVLTFEHEDSRGNDEHIVATNNIMRQALRAMGNNDTVAISLLSEGDVDRHFTAAQQQQNRDGVNQFVQRAAVIQSSTSTRFNAEYEARFVNPETIFVASGGNVHTGASNPQEARTTQDPTPSRHLAFVHMVEFGASINGVVQDYTSADGQSLVTAPMFSPNFPFHHPQTGPYRGRFEQGTSFASPLGAVILAQARADYPNLQPHHILYAMAQTAEPVTRVDGMSRPLLYLATPHGLEFSHMAGAGELRRDRMYRMLDRMSDYVTQHPEAAIEAQRDQPVIFNAPVARVEQGQSIYNLPITDTNRIASRPVFAIEFPRNAAAAPMTVAITAPNGTTQQYKIDPRASNGTAYITGTGFFGATIEGNWQISLHNDRNETLPVSRITMHTISVPATDVINQPQFRNVFTRTNLVGQDLSRFSDIYIQPDPSSNFAGGWLSRATAEGWLSRMDLTGTALSDPLRATLPPPVDYPMPPQPRLQPRRNQRRADIADSTIPVILAEGITASDAEEVLSRAAEFIRINGTPTAEGQSPQDNPQAQSASLTTPLTPAARSLDINSIS
jgi:hypothetical protein